MYPLYLPCKSLHPLPWEDWVVVRGVLFVTMLAPRSNTASNIIDSTDHICDHYCILKVWHCHIVWTDLGWNGLMLNEMQNSLFSMKIDRYIFKNPEDEPASHCLYVRRQTWFKNHLKIPNCFSVVIHVTVTALFEMSVFNHSEMFLFFWRNSFMSLLLSHSPIVNWFLSVLTIVVCSCS